MEDYKIRWRYNNWTEDMKWLLSEALLNPETQALYVPPCILNWLVDTVYLPYDKLPEESRKYFVEHIVGDEE